MCPPGDEEDNECAEGEGARAYEKRKDLLPRRSDLRTTNVEWAARGHTRTGRMCLPILNQPRQ
jgi:hypothetical protein